MVKEFTYHGLSKEELSNIPNEKLLKFFTARIRRSLTRGTMSDDKKKLMEEMRDKNNKNPIKTHLRDVIILPYMIGKTVQVFSGKEFVPIIITIQMVGHYLGEYVITNKRVNHGAPGVGASRSSLYVPLK